MLHALAGAASTATTLATASGALRPFNTVTCCRARCPVSTHLPQVVRSIVPGCACVHVRIAMASRDLGDPTLRHLNLNAAIRAGGRHPSLRHVSAMRTTGCLPRFTRSNEGKPIKIAVAVSLCWLPVPFTLELEAAALRGARTRHGARATTRR